MNCLAQALRLPLDLGWFGVLGTNRQLAGVSPVLPNTGSDSTR
jgi:hypothetical protein